ncbi:G-type lectin S-receptor-like serine/threonine-protein kinase At4g27290 isoform X2 [Salvia miltiorrhiza]|uniref:G-type lectin S-receptor-like serine/threonine-protein kinase At4g27290 isoform X2 n=1 Tax=Salvia miltiorrhiza TaxID=226208 RepID=UPI0025ACF4C2|nr:G-type lectin S-receptor-like serine/threonine-protein kinase At4g27290 isoform X2 [Salvia miltiorrhiza]
MQSSILSLKMKQIIQILCAALSLLAIFDYSPAAAIATLSPGQTLSHGQLLSSPAQIFELGFFSPANSTAKFLGIWYRATPDVVVWVANRQNPITGLTGVLTLSKTGNLILSSAQGTTTWSSNSSTAAASNPVLRLLDTGNLVLAENATNIWMSFDYPCDTRLPGMKMVYDSGAGLDKHLTSWKSPADPSPGDFVYKIENHGLPQMSILMGNEKKYRTGPWNGRNFTGLPFVRDPAYGAEIINGRLISYSDPYNSSIYMRLTMDSSGLLQRYTMNEERDGWILMYTIPSETCSNYAWCGANALCKPNTSPVCECLKGFMPKSEKEWSSYGWTSGCGRIPPLDCQKEDGFMKVDRVKFPDTLSFRVDDSMSVDDCREECLRNCNCSAYADPYLSFSTERNGCLMWFGDLVDVMEFTGEVSTGPRIYIRVPKTELEHMTDWSERKGSKKLVFVATAASLGMLFLIICFGGIIVRRRRACKKESEDLELPLFGLKTIAAATNNFSDENLIGEGGFGPVYKGSLSAELAIAVKRMSRTSGQGPEEFKNEVILIAKLQHRNLVRILGCCIGGEEKMLIYEYMHNKSLDYFIFDENRRGLLTWQMRFDIIMGIARGLLYLHHDSRLKIIHRDLKTSNILLDEKLDAKISDFGLARMFEGDQTMARTKRVVGTYGYMAPEYAFQGKFSVKSDVFSLGVVILEIVSGKKNRGFKHPSCYQNLLEQAWLLWMENRELELMDPCYSNSCVDAQVKRCIQVGLLCVQNAGDDRPMMPSVLLMLSSEDTVLGQPKKPGFFLNSSPTFSERNASASSEESTTASITITEVQGR